MAFETSFDPYQFRHRHIGPSPDEVRVCWKSSGRRHLMR